MDTTYIDKFIIKKRSPELLLSKFYPNVKEITESVGGLEAAKKFIQANEEGVLAICVGDGQTPRTGLYVAYNTSWNVISVDPNFNLDSINRAYKILDNKRSPIKRLSFLNCKIKNASFDFTDIKKLVYICVHSHAKLSDLFIPKNINTYIISIPCCVNDNLTFGLINSYNDKRILSPRNKVNIYNYNNYLKPLINCTIETDNNYSYFKFIKVDEELRSKSYLELKTLERFNEFIISSGNYPGYDKYNKKIFIFGKSKNLDNIIINCDKEAILTLEEAGCKIEIKDLNKINSYWLEQSTKIVYQYKINIRKFPEHNENSFNYMFFDKWGRFSARNDFYGLVQVKNWEGDII